MQATRTVLYLRTGGSVRRSQWRVQLTEKGVDQQHQSMNATVATFYSWQRRGIAVVSHYRECPPILVCKCGSKSCSRVHVVVAEFWDTLQSQLPEEWLLFTKLFAGALWPLLFLLATTSRFLTGKAHPESTDKPSFQPCLSRQAASGDWYLRMQLAAEQPISIPVISKRVALTIQHVTRRMLELSH